MKKIINGKKYDLECDEFENIFGEVEEISSEKGKKLADLRRQAKLTQQDLADLSGLDIRLVQKYELGEYDVANMTLRTAKALAAALDCSMDDFMR